MPVQKDVGRMKHFILSSIAVALLLALLAPTTLMASRWQCEIVAPGDPSPGIHQWTCTAVPIPTLTEWGLIILAFLLGAMMLLALSRRRRRVCEKPL
jgi:hypothetical protein